MAPNARRPALGGLLAGCLLAVAGISCLRHAGEQEAFVGQPSVANRRQLVQRQAVDKAMKERIVSVQKTGKLTDAMRLVAAAKVRRAQDGVAKSRPFSDELQGMIKGLVKKLKGSGLEQELPMLKVPDKVNNVCIMLITANRGLCGAYNTFIIKKAIARVRELNKLGISPKIVIVGKKGLQGVNGRFANALPPIDYQYDGKFFGMPDTITATSAGEIGDEVRNIFLSGEADKVEIIYGKFYSLLKNEATIRSMLPLSPVGIEASDDETFTMTTEDGALKVEKEKVKAAKTKEIESDVIFDQEPAVILNSMLPLYLNSQLLSLLFDAQASELSSRMTAMQAATNNAKDLSARLLLMFNKKRQAAITAEICEIAAGAMCLESSASKSGPPLGVFDNEDTVGDDFLKELEGEGLPDVPQNPEGPADRQAAVAAM